MGTRKWLAGLVQGAISSMRLRPLFLLCVLFAASLAWAQWKRVSFGPVNFEPTDARAGEIVKVHVPFKVETGWHFYTMDKDRVPVGVPTEFTVEGVELAGKIIAPPVVTKMDPTENKPVDSYEGEGEFVVPIRLPKGAKGEVSAKLSIRTQSCDQSRCERPTIDDLALNLAVAPGEARPDVAGTAKSDPQPSPIPTSGQDEVAERIQRAQDSGLFSYLVLAFVAGLTALITPCVFPMIPITVSFFSKKVDGEKKTNYKGAALYCAGIIGTFTGLGLIVTAAYGASGIRAIANNPWVNIALAVLFVVLAGNLFGLFEIVIPSGLVNKLSAGSRSGSVLAPVLMGLTFSVTSFTCTVPFVGTLLATAAAKGDYLYPTLGMLAFSTAFALPFFLLALFPQALARMPKSGGWLATVKAFMGFLELVATVYYLSKADLVWQTYWLPKPVFLALWAAIFAVGGLYMLGWLRLGHDLGAVKIGWGRRLVGVGTLAIAVLCLDAIRGRNLGTFESFLPPELPTKSADDGWQRDYQGALALARREGKNVFIDFTGINCTNCRLMERNVFPVASVKAELDRFIRVRLYTDRGTPEDDKNYELQKKLAKVDTLPVYVMVTPDGEVLKVHQQEPPLDSQSNIDNFVSVLRSAQPKRIASIKP